MMDLSDKGSDCEEMSSQTPTPDRVSSDGANVKTCVDCGTSKTPLWRGGPAGPKSLCNACGIRSRKKRRALMGVTKEEKKTKKPTMAKNISHQRNSSNSSTISIGDSAGKIGDSLMKKLWAFGRDVALQRPRSNTNRMQRPRSDTNRMQRPRSDTNRRRKLGEEEQAAFLLMALSCGSVYA